MTVADIIRTRVRVPCLIAAATIQGQHLFKEIWIHLILVFCIHLHSANIHAEDCDLCTPVLLAAGCKHSTTHAFDCLMSYLELENAKQNPLIQVLKVKSNQEKLLRVKNNEVIDCIMITCLIAILLCTLLYTTIAVSGQRQNVGTKTEKLYSRGWKHPIACCC